jgi:hypothetical protein
MKREDRVCARGTLVNWATPCAASAMSARDIDIRILVEIGIVVIRRIPIVVYR